MNIIKILFFGSTSDSVIVLERLHQLSKNNLSIVGIVTQPARPIGRDKIITPTPVESWATCQHVTTLTFPTNPEKPWLYQNEQQVIDALQPIKADLLISASFGVKIPWEIIKHVPYGGINIHPSILPHWRGADPVPWAIMSGDHQIGVTVVTLSQTFDEGKILAQKKIPILPTDFSDLLRTKLFTIGADILTEALPDYIHGNLKGKSTQSALHSGSVKLPYARRFTRDDGFEPWETIHQAIATGIEGDRLERKYRALHPWPGIWTIIRYGVRGMGYEEKRLKILKLHFASLTHATLPLPHTLVLDEVQLEGKKPVPWKQFSASYLPHI